MYRYNWLSAKKQQEYFYFHIFYSRDPIGFLAINQGC